MPAFAAHAHSPLGHDPLHLAGQCPAAHHSVELWVDSSQPPFRGQPADPQLSRRRRRGGVPGTSPASSLITGSLLGPINPPILLHWLFTDLGQFVSRSPKRPLPLGQVFCKLCSLHRVNKLIAIHSLFLPSSCPVLAVPPTPPPTPQAVKCPPGSYFRLLRLWVP